jgi:ketosteroid isomerase-like protein
LKSTEIEVMEAAAQVVAAFGSHDKEKYFGCFSPEASFLFYSSNKRFNSRQEYEEEWKSWEEEGFKVHSCLSSDAKVTESRVAIFTHSVRTDLSMGEERVTNRERETIVFEQVDGRWLAIHEHLSPDPNLI